MVPAGAERRWRLALGFAVGAFLLGLGRLASIPFEAGDVYPPYSSLRADPLGCRAFHDALRELPGLRVSRSFRARDLTGAPGDTALLVLALPEEGLSAVDSASAGRLEALAAAGGRVVLALRPREKAESKAKAAPPARPDAGDAEVPRTVSLADRWGFRLANGKDVGPAVSAGRSLGAGVPWHGRTRLEATGPWRTMLSRGGETVLAERPWGKGTLVVATDCTFTSNEALRQAPRPALLAWLVGSEAAVVFDEEHLGVREHVGVLALARRHRLHGLGAGLLAVAALALWRAAAGFGRRVGEEGDGDEAVGRGAGEALENLLRRSVPEEDLLRLCLEQWRAAGCHRRLPASRAEAVEELWRRVVSRPAAKQDAAAAYREIARILN